MASPQTEDGHLKIALDLAVAICRNGFSSLERQILDAIMLLTYGRQQSKAEIGIDDIQALAGLGLRPGRIVSSLDKLIAENVIFRQKLPREKQLLGVQKDFDRWYSVDNRSQRTNFSPMEEIKSISLKELSTSSADILYAYTLTALKLKPSIKSQRIDLAAARKLYAEALRLTRSADDARWAIKDYVDYLCEDDWFRTKTKFPFAYMLPRFSRWHGSIPKKTRDIREEEQHLGRHMRWNFKAKCYEVTNDRLE